MEANKEEVNESSMFEHAAVGQLRRNVPDAAIRRLLELRLDPSPNAQALREAADDALAGILSLETGIEDD